MFGRNPPYGHDVHAVSRAKASVQQTGRSPSAKAAPRGPGRVLVADDDEQVRKVLCEVLRRAGLDVVTAKDAASAMREVANNDLDAVVSDIRMDSDEAGIELLKAVRESDLDLPVILVTGLPCVDTAIHALRYGALNYLPKPVSGKVLVSEVKRAVHLYRIAQLRRQSTSELGVNPAMPDRAALEVSLDRALATTYMVYQPVVRWSNQSVFAYEALVRCKEPSIPHPGALIEAAERLGRLNDLGRKVRSIANAPLADAPEDALLLVNLHTQDLLDENLYDPSSILARDASRVILEITERARLESVGDPKPHIRRLRDLGYRIAIDDIGAGYSGLTSFVTLAPELLKVDMSLVRDVEKSDVKRRLVKALVDLCVDLETPLIAEGVETVAERDCLVELGCDLFQGYLFARPELPFVTPKF